MSEASAPLPSTFPDGADPLLVRGYIRFADEGGRALLAAVERELGEAAAAFLLPPVAGGDFFGDIFELVGAIKDFVFNKVSSAPSFLSGAVPSFNFIGSILDQIFFTPIRTIYQAIFDVAGNAFTIATSAAGWLLAAAQKLGDIAWNILTWLGNFLRNAIHFVGDQLWSIISWAGNRVWDGITFVGNQLWGIISAVGNLIWSIISSAGNLIWSGITNVGNQLWSIISAVGNQLWSIISWAGNQLYQGALYVGNQTWNGLNWLGQELRRLLDYAIRTVIDNAFAPIAGFIAQKLAIPRRFLTGEFKTMDAFLDAWEDPPRPGGIEGVFLSFLGMVAIIAGGVFTWGPIAGASITESMMLKFEPTIPSQVQLRDAYLRDFIGEAAHDDALGRLGFSDARIAYLKRLYQLEPTPSDLIRFLVREVYDPQVRGRFQLDAEFPGQAVAEGRKIGLFEQTLRNYWAAHWDLPAVGQGYTMFHRGVIDQADLELLLRTKDVMPFWRQNLVDIAYNVPGRIDLRRMFAAGVIDEPRVNRGYLDLGYKPEDAKILTAFAVKSAAGNPPDLPRGTITTAYRDGVLSRAQAETELEALGFDADDVALFLDLEDLRNAQVLANLGEDVIEADFKAGLINEGAARAALVEVGTPSARVDLLLALWRNRKAIKTTTLSVAAVQRALREGLLSEGQAQGRISAAGYNDEDVKLLIDLATPDPAEKEPPALTLAQLFRAWREDLLTETELRGRLATRGYTSADADILVELASPDAAPEEPAELTKADVRALLKAKLIDLQEAERRLKAKGLTAIDTQLLLKLWQGVAA